MRKAKFIIALVHVEQGKGVFAFGVVKRELPLPFLTLRLHYLLLLTVLLRLLVPMLLHSSAATGTPTAS